MKKGLKGGVGEKSSFSFILLFFRFCLASFVATSPECQYRTSIAEAPSSLSLTHRAMAWTNGTKRVDEK